MKNKIQFLYLEFQYREIEKDIDISNFSKYDNDDVFFNEINFE